MIKWDETLKALGVQPGWGVLSVSSSHSCRWGRRQGGDQRASWRRQTLRQSLAGRREGIPSAPVPPPAPSQKASPPSSVCVVPRADSAPAEPRQGHMIQSWPMCLVAQSFLTLRHPMDCSLPGKNTGGGCHSLLQGIFTIQGLNPRLPHCGQILYRLSHQGSPMGGQHLPAELIGWRVGTRLQQSHSESRCARPEGPAGLAVLRLLEDESEAACWGMRPAESQV